MNQTLDNLNMKHLPLLIFFAVSLLNLLGVATANDTLIYISKPLLMPALMVWLIVETNHHGEFTFRRRSVIGALVFSTLGDVLLMFAGEIFFILGLFCFLLAHVFYIGAFAAIANHKNGFLTRNPAWVLPFVAFPVLLLYFLWSGIPVGMKIPVVAYAGVISAMALSVVNLKGKVADSIFWPMLAGAVLFLISDSLIAVAKFGQPFDGERVAIMATYILGQFLLVRGVVEVLKAMRAA